MAEPKATEPVDLVREILRPHGLTIRSEAGRSPCGAFRQRRFAGRERRPRL